MIQVNNHFFNSLALNYFKSELRITDMRDFMFDETKKKKH